MQQEREHPLDADDEAAWPVVDENSEAYFLAPQRASAVEALVPAAVVQGHAAVQRHLLEDLEREPQKMDREEGQQAMEPRMVEVGLVEPCRLPQALSRKDFELADLEWKPLMPDLRFRSFRTNQQDLGLHLRWLDQP